MKSAAWLLGAALFLATSCLVDFTQAAGDCLCGIVPANLPCSICGQNGPDVLVRAAVPPKPAFFSSPKAINEAANLRPVYQPYPSRCSPPPTIYDEEDLDCRALGGLNSAALLTLGPNEAVVPKFLPVGDLCNSRGGTLPTPSASVIPAIPVKPCYNRGTLATALAAEQQALAASQGSQLIGLDGPLVAGSGCAAAPTASSGPAPNGAGGPAGICGLAQSLGWSGSGALLLSNLLGPQPGGFTSLNQASAQNEVLNSFQEEEELTFEEQEKVYNGQTLPAVPADPVSISLAYKQLLQPLITQTKRTIQRGSEEALSFGPMAVPKDGRKQAIGPDIPEERLINIDRPVVELKLNPASAGLNRCAPTEDDEALATLEALERERIQREQEKKASSSVPCSYISFSDLGYAPVAPSKNSFITLPASCQPASQPADPADELPCGPLGPPLPGYVPGSVVFKPAKPCGNNAQLGLDTRALPADSSVEEEEENESGERLRPLKIIGGGCRRCAASPCTCDYN